MVLDIPSTTETSLRDAEDVVHLFPGTPLRFMPGYSIVHPPDLSINVFSLTQASISHLPYCTCSLTTKIFMHRSILINALFPNTDAINQLSQN